MKKTVSLMIMLLLVCYGLTAEDNKKKMSLEDTILHAMENNLGLKIETTNTLSADNNLTISKGIFIPKLEMGYGYTDATSPSVRDLEGAPIKKDKTNRFSLNLSHKNSFGGTISGTAFYYKSKSNDSFASFNPYYQGNIELSYTQPLLKGFGLTATKRNIYVNANNRKKSLYTLKQKVMDLVLNVENAYWDLVSALGNLEVQKQSLKRSKELLRQNEIKVKVGTSAPIDILESKAEVANYESQVINAERRIQSSQENLKKILNLSKSNVIVVPTDEPDVNAVETNFDKFIAEALRNRPDVEKAKLDLKNYKIDVKYYKNQLLPELNIKGSYTSKGVGGLSRKTDSEGNPKPADELVDRSYWDAMNDVLKRKYGTYSLTVNFNIPLWLSKEKAELGNARLNLKKALLSLKDTENTVYSEVKDVIVELQNNMKQYEADKLRLELEVKKLKAEEKKLSVGISSNYDVLVKQRDLANAESQLLTARINYSKTVSKINKILARTFKVYNIDFKDILKK